MASLSAFASGFALSTALIVAIGAQNAFVLHQGLRREHVGPIVIFCSLADFALMAAGVAGLALLIGQLPGLELALTLGGATFLTWYGVAALSRAARPRALSAEGEDTPTLAATLAKVAAFTFLNPHVYLDTVILVGAIGASQPEAGRVTFVAGAALASALWFASLGYGARLLAPVFARPGAWQALDLVIGATMLILAAGLILRATSLGP